MSNHAFAEYSATLKTVNVTQASIDFVSWLHTERGVVVQVEVVTVLSVLLHTVQVVCGWWRRCSSNSYIKYSLWLAYTVNPSVVLYTFGLMSASSCRSSLFTAFTVALLFALGGTNFVTAYSIDDNKQYTRHFIQQCLYAVSFLFVWKTYVSDITSFYTLFYLIFETLYFLMISINPGRIHASMTASSFLDKQTSNVVEHMESNHTEFTIRHDPATLAGYDYLVYEKIDSPTEITVSEIWASHEDLLGNSDGKQLKEVCLSFALFRLLRRRFFGIACPESKLQKTRDLVMDGLLSDLENNNCDPAYRVIAAELAFTYDHFFTSSASLNSILGPLIIVLGIGKVFIHLAWGVLLILDFVGNKTSSSMHIVPTTLCDTILASVIMVVLSSLELLQLYLYFSSDWAKVQLVRCSISGTRFPFGFRRFYNKLGLIFGYWQNKVGQHSLLKDLHGRSFISDFIGSLSGCFFGGFLYHSVISRGISDPGIKEPDHIGLTGDVKLAVARALKDSNGQLSNGAFSLRRNAQCGLLWACQQENHISTLLIWHIATDYCDIAQSCGEGEQRSPESNRKIASTLSSYCAYLMACVPELLPGHELGTRKLFDKVRRYALNILSDARELHEKYRMLQNVGVQASDERIFTEGIRLGKQLEEIGDAMHWNILADFWTEMILYIAPSDNAKGHFEQLANGGEFLTHLWALLFHAGITERDELNLDVENVDPHEAIMQNAGNNQTHQETQNLEIRSTGLHEESMQHSMNIETHQACDEASTSTEYRGANRRGTRRYQSSGGMI